jgi:hypothetical protein
MASTPTAYAVAYAFWNNGHMTDLLAAIWANSPLLYVLSGLMLLGAFGVFITLMVIDLRR